MRRDNNHKSVNSQSKPRALGIAVMLALSSTPALADDSPNLLDDRFQLSLGTFGIDNQPEISLYGETGDGTNVKFDRLIGGGEAYRFRMDGGWRFAERHKVRLSVFAMSREKRKEIDQDIDWGGETIPANAVVKAEHQFEVIEASYEYSLLKRENYELDASIGLHWTALDASLKATVTTPGGGGSAEIGDKASVDLPLPAIGVRGLVSLTHDFWLTASARYFALSIDEYDGSLQDYVISLTWQPKRWVGVGIGYNQFTVDVDVDKDSFNGSIDWTYKGPMIFYNASF